MKQTLAMLLVACGTLFILSACGGDSERAVQATSAITCTADNQCPSGEFCNTATDFNVCLPNHCRDGQKNGGESDVDCGGDCQPAYLCPNGDTCSEGPDCVSGNCQGGVCVPGGTTTGCPGGCPSGQSCINNSCQPTPTGNLCGGQQCQAPQICGATNTCITPGTVQPGGACTSNSQCLSGLCFSNGTCAPPPFSLKVPAGTTVSFYPPSGPPTRQVGSSDQNTAINSSPTNNETGATAPGAASCTFQTYCTNGFIPCQRGTGNVFTVGWNFCTGG